MPSTRIQPCRGGAPWLFGVVLAVSCRPEASPPPVAVRAQAIIGGEPAEQTGFARIWHVAGDKICSGALIANELVLTAKHCVLRDDAGGARALSPEGFRIEFGASSQSAVQATAAAVTWIGAPDDLDVAAAVAAGEDVAVVQLSMPAPDGETVRDVALDFAPVDGAEVFLAGYGVTDAQTGRNGERTLGSGRLTGFDPDTGVIQVSGDSICFGDSGGPVLDGQLERVIGVLGEVGGSSENQFCDIGLSFAATAANAAVSRILARECAAVGGCGRQAVQHRDDAAVDASAPVRDAAAAHGDGSVATPSDAGDDAGSHETDGRDADARVERRERNGGCAAAGSAGVEVALGWVLAFAGWVLLRVRAPAPVRGRFWMGS